MENQSNLYYEAHQKGWKKWLLFIACIIFIVIVLSVSTFLPEKRQQLPYNQTFEFKSTKQSYRVIGNGPEVIMVHGSLLSNPWSHWEEKLAKNYKVYLIDLPGYGASDAIEGEIHNTDLFAQSLCEFIQQNNLQKSPIISFSLGTIVAIRASAKNCTQGKQILVGVPGKVTGTQVEIAEKVPLSIRRYLASTRFGKETFLIPIVYGNVGEESTRAKQKTLELLSQNDPKTSADIDVKKEIEEDLPKLLPKVKNETVFIYGGNDLLKTTTKNLISDFIEIPNSGHNIFAYQPEKSSEVIEKELGK
ncbi:MAG TPA: alpha/beta hydrolase [Patescibacteria group bacterium]